MSHLPNAISQAIASLQKDYDAFDLDNKGANGYMFFAKNKNTGQRVAIKFYAGEPGDAQHDEPKQLAKINSPNVIQILDARSEDDGWAYFLTPFCQEGDLDNFIASKPTLFRAIDVALGICNGVSALHAHNLVHRDLKPGNIVLNNGVPQIADFGSVRALSSPQGSVHASKHSVLYRPPESFETGEYTKQGDIYQVGLVIYQLFGGALSYDPVDYMSANEKTEYLKISSQAEKSAFEDGVVAKRANAGTLFQPKSLAPWVTTKARSLIRQALAPKPNQRFGTIIDLASALTSLRAKSVNWGWQGNVARGSLKNKKIELRPIGPELYEAWQQISGDFRRVPVVPASSLADLVKRWKS